MGFMRRSFGSRVVMWPMQFDLGKLSCTGCLCLLEDITCGEWLKVCAIIRIESLRN